MNNFFLYFIQFLILTLSLFSFTSCSLVSKKLESITTEKEQKKNNPPIVNLKNNYCPNKSNLQYLSEDDFSLKFYRNLHPSLFENKNLPFIQKAIMLSLVEMARRPDESSPYSRLQIYLKLKGQQYYFDFHPKDANDHDKMPFLKGLDYISKKFLPGQKLISIANSLDQILPKNIEVSFELETFLSENKKELAKNEELSERFFKGDEVLTKYETFAKVNLAHIIKKYQNLKFDQDSDYELESGKLNYRNSQQEKYEVSCNLDLPSEPKNTDQISSSALKKSHYIGFTEGDNVYLAVSSSLLQRPFSVGEAGYFIKSWSSPTPMPVCDFKGGNHEIVLFSVSDRNPAQHLQHLSSYGIDQINSSYVLNELLSFSRHLFLSNPDRILYESKRGRKAQLNLFLAMNFPIYHVDSLGLIFGHATFKTGKDTLQSLHIDDRSTARLWCRP